MNNDDFQLGLGNLPPQDISTEESILGAMMLERDSVDVVIGILKKNDFYKDSHVLIFEAITTLYYQNDPVDIKTVTNQLRKNKHLDLVKGAHYVVSLTTKVNSSANIEAHCLIIKELSMKRQLINLGYEIIKQGYRDESNAFDLIADADNKLVNMTDNPSSTTHIGDPNKIRDVIEKVENAKKQNEKNEVTGIPSGFTRIDKYFGGFQPTDLVIIAARPAMGKTAFIASIIKYLGIDRKIPIGMFSLEMTWEQISIRILSMISEVSGNKFRSGDITDQEMLTIMEMGGKELSNAPIYIDDSPSLNIIQIKSKARNLVRKHGVQILFLDYLQLADGINSNSRNREQDVSQVSRGLKHIAKELKIPIIALAQLSRSVETRGGDKRPELADLRESGSIEQDADIVAFLYRPEYYGIDQIETMPGHIESSSGIGEVIIKKNRNGKLGSEYLKFIGKFTKWENEDPVAIDTQKDLFTRDPSGPNKYNEDLPF